jgi:hypothetical protein
MRLAGKTREELSAALADKKRAELVELIYRLTTFEHHLTAREIADATHCRRRDVLADMRAGRFVDPIFGSGFFCRSENSLRVSASAANAWREQFFVPVDSIPADKKRRARTRVTDVRAKKTAQRRTADRSALLADNGAR